MGQEHMVSLHDCYCGCCILKHGTPSRHVYGDDSLSRCDRAEHNRLTFSDKQQNPQLPPSLASLDLAAFFASVQSPVIFRPSFAGKFLDSPEPLIVPPVRVRVIHTPGLCCDRGNCVAWRVWHFFNVLNCFF